MVDEADFLRENKQESYLQADCITLGKLEITFYKMILLKVSF